MIPIKIVGATSKATSTATSTVDKVAAGADLGDAAGVALKYLKSGALNLTALPPLSLYTVSYTHLTLPTSDLV